MEGECDQAFGSLEGAKGTEAAVVHPAPCALELLPGRLPFVELPLPDLAPALETCHVDPPTASLCIRYGDKYQITSYIHLGDIAGGGKLDALTSRSTAV